MKTIGLVCREIRLDKGLTLKDLSKRTDINMKTLSAFEHGRSTNMNILIHYLDLVTDVERNQIMSEIMGVYYDNKK